METKTNDYAIRPCRQTWQYCNGDCYGCEKVAKSIIYSSNTSLEDFENENM